MSPWPDPTLEMLQSEPFEAVWQCIKRWDINVPHAYVGYMGATGNHVRAILDALAPWVPQDDGGSVGETIPVTFQFAKGARVRIALASDQDVWIVHSRIYEERGILGPVLTYRLARPGELGLMEVVELDLLPAAEAPTHD